MEVRICRFNTISRPLWLNAQFGRMMAISLLLHIFAFIPFFFAGHAGFAGPSVPFLDLNMGMEAKSDPLSNPAKGAVKENVETPAPPQPVPAPPLSELDKLREHSQRSLDNAASQPGAVQDASLGLSITSGYFGAIGEGESLRDDIREYYFEILRSINAKWWLNRENQQAGRNRAVFYLVIARDGTIVDRMLVTSSGNPAYDRAMMRTLEASSPLPPLPESYRGDFFQAPLRFNVPLNLLNSLHTAS
jgi:periplasmic protein TonB